MTQENYEYRTSPLMLRNQFSGEAPWQIPMIPKGSTVAVSTYMVSEHGHHADQKGFFMKGYRELLRRIEPERIICYNEPFPEMEGNIVYVDYELSSWKYQNKA